MQVHFYCHYWLRYHFSRTLHSSVRTWIQDFSPRVTHIFHAPLCIFHISHVHMRSAIYSDRTMSDARSGVLQSQLQMNLDPEMKFQQWKIISTVLVLNFVRVSLKDVKKKKGIQTKKCFESKKNIQFLLRSPM